MRRMHTAFRPGACLQVLLTPELLEEKRKQAIAQGRKASYDRTCRDCAPTDPAGRPFVLRFKTPLTGTVAFDDMVRGTISFQVEELDDLIILRTDGTPTYNFTVVVDDALMGMTNILRGRRPH